jgi:ABC-type transport system involved in multi-copper enzyme maturation permease subunit
MNQLRSELRKLLSTKTWLFLGLGAIAFTLLNTLATFFISKNVDSSTADGAPGLSLQTAQGVQNVYATVGSIGYLFALILGIVAMTSEFRFGTIVPTFLATPQRHRSVLAKILTLGIIGGAMGLAVVVIAFVTTTILLATTDHASVSYTDVTLVALGAMLAYVLMSILGVALGALLRNQILGVVLAILWVFIIESIITVVLNLNHLQYISKWLPASAVAAVVGAADPRSSDTLPAWGAALVLLAYAAVFTVAAFGTTLRRDVS